MKLMIHNNQLDVRGSTVAAIDYAKYAQDMLGCEIVFSYDLTNPHTNADMRSRIGSKFNLIGHNGFSDIEQIIDQEKIDFAYFLRGGGKEFVPTNCRTGVHAIFQHYAPHGDRYAYVSEWLSQKMNPGTPWVPHMASLPAPSEDLRESLGIGKDKFVFGRIGAKETFNLGFVHYAIHKLLQERNDFVFVFVGTNKWVEHPNVIFLPEVQDPQLKSNIINTWDAMIHGRSEGESFGVAMVEALSLGKPVLSWEGGYDLNHTLILKDSDLLYSQNNVFDKMLNIRDYVNKEDWTQRVANFRPAPVMEKFNEVFLKD